MSAQTFFGRHPVFSVHEFEDYLRHEGSPTEHNRKRLLAYHRRQGRIAPIRPGLYGSIPPGRDAATYPIDGVLVASRLTDDALIGYHSALAFHGVAHSLRNEQILVTAHPFARPFVFQGTTYRTVSPPRALAEKQAETFGVERRDRLGEEVRVTSLERTLVDSLDRPRLGGGWEETWRSYEAVPYLDLEQVANYALLLDNATTIAKVGYVLESQRERWMVDEEHLAVLRAHRPRRPHYLNRRREEPARMVKAWNLIVPERILSRAWEEAGERVA